jgi:hypothetical protein
MLAADSGRAEIIDYLIKQHANVYILSPYGNTALHYALNAYNAIPDHKETYSGESAIKTIGILVKNGSILLAGSAEREKFSFGNRSNFELIEKIYRDAFDSVNKILASSSSSSLPLSEHKDEAKADSGLVIKHCIDVKDTGVVHSLIRLSDDEIALMSSNNLTDDDFAAFMEPEPEAKERAPVAGGTSHASAVALNRSGNFPSR